MRTARNFIHMLKAAILAGGRGTRLRPVTDVIPKPMIEIGGKPFLEHQINLLSKNGVAEILLCVGYLREKIMDYFGNGSRFGLKIDYSIEEGFLGTGGALKKAKKCLQKDFILLYGDSYLPIDYTRLVNSWSQCSSLGLVVCYDNKDGIAVNNIYLDKEDFIREYNKSHPNKCMNCLEAGVMVFKKEVLESMADNRVISLEEEIFPLLIKQGKLRGYLTGQRFYDIGTPQGLKEMKELLQ